MRLFILLLFCFQGNVCSEEKTHCTEQPDSIRVEKGGSVIIPCHFSYLKNDKPEEVRVFWRHATEGRCANNEVIYKHHERWIHADYGGRISMEGNPELERTATIRIQKLRDTDGPMFCCRISLYYNGQPYDSWQNRHGTYIKFKDQFSVEQPDVVPAVIGEDISIPCALHNRSSDAIEEIIWRVGTRDLCFENNEFLIWNTQNITQKFGRWSVQKSENSFLLQIKSITDSDRWQYCCELKTKTRSDGRSSTHGTQVVIADPTQNDPKFTVTQPENITANKGTSVTISCSYTVPPDRNLLWSGVFWRVGSPTGPYAYHPSDLMVHHNYSGRTQLNGSTDLQINGAQDTDTTTYYCFVMLKFCIGTDKTNSVLKYGNGTQLYRSVKNQTSTGQQILILAVYFGIKTFLFVLSIILCAIYMKKSDHTNIQTE
ncbi:protein turtle homolog B-like [Aquarana catesbeiana]|uniref:protein turtle homolog B-like n=1 Tax=Aquarana catesbeiana TaxID=8400 RepID=UPI003CC9775E